MKHFDYSSPAEIYAAGSKRAGRPSMTYRRFETAAKAIRYSIEELPQTGVCNVALEVDGERYHHKEILRLYDAKSYPLRRHYGEPLGLASAV